MSEPPANRYIARIPPEHTPFNAPGHEPRFALELPFTDAETIGDALRCVELVIGDVPRGWLAFSDDEGKWLAVCGEGSFAANFPTISTLERFTGLDRRECALGIRKWLVERADYGEKPWFDGGATRGMRMFHVGFGQEPKRFYGWTVIQPHWIEVHQ